MGSVHFSQQSPLLVFAGWQRQLLIIQLHLGLWRHLLLTCLGQVGLAVWVCHGWGHCPGSAVLEGRVPLVRTNGQDCPWVPFPGEATVGQAL